MRAVYALLCVAGTLWPLAQFAPWLSEHGLDLPLLIRQATASPVAAFAWSDVLVSGAVVVALILVEGRRLGMRRLWLPLLGLGVGVSLALPLFLFLRERHLAAGGHGRV
ncbi:DUF2834 domain-containing protein [Lysobacter firmicutimachus]|uniref:DUF2834 domain-containing protein n=1 Tax=Lysobacter firmicutimachus TaxID=1792846 RepID=A0AAU8MYZ9_9GAMM